MPGDLPVVTGAARIIHHGVDGVDRQHAQIAQNQKGRAGQNRHCYECCHHADNIRANPGKIWASAGKKKEELTPDPFVCEPPGRLLSLLCGPAALNCGFLGS